MAPRHEIRDVVARTLHGRSWDERALDKVLAKIDANVGPPMIDASSFLVRDEATATATTLAPVTTIQVDPILRYFVDAERKYAERHASPLLPTKASLAALVIDDSPEIEEEAIAPIQQTSGDAQQLVTVAEVPPQASRTRTGKRVKVPHIAWPQLQELTAAQTTPPPAGKRTRRRRERNTGHADILLVNSSGRPQLRACWTDTPKQVAVIINQEHQSRDIA